MTINPGPTQEQVHSASRLLSTIPLLEGLTIENFTELAPRIKTYTFKQGEVLFRQGDPGGALMIVVDGQVELYVYDDHNQPIVLTTVGPGGFFGEVTLFNKGLRTTFARAVETTRVMVLTTEVMNDFFNIHPQAAIHMISVLSERLRATTALVTDKGPDATEVLRRQMNLWERIADRSARAMGSGRYLTTVIVFISCWIIMNSTSVLGRWDEPPEFFTLVTILTLIGAIGTPLILISQRRQSRLDKIQAELDRQANLKAEMAILEVKGKLEWLQEAMLDNSGRLNHLERETETIRRSAAKITTPRKSGRLALSENVPRRPPPDSDPARE